MPIAVKGGEVGARYVGGTRSKMHLDLHLSLYVKAALYNPATTYDK